MKRQSTIAGKQSVTFRMLTNEGLSTLIELPKAAARILLKIIKHSNKHDNCLQLSTPQLISMYNLNQSNVYTHIRHLKKVDFLKEVFDIDGASRLMVNPVFISWQTRDRIRFSILMYALGSHHETLKLRDSEKHQGGRINPITGEVHDWFYNGLELVDQQQKPFQHSGYEYIPISLLNHS